MPQRQMPSATEILTNKKVRDSLSLSQLSAFVNTIVAHAKGMGNTNIPNQPADLAYKLSNGRWKHSAHLDYLSSRLAALQRREIKGLIVSMPPRHGKSTLIDENFPVWWLAKAPASHVALTGYGDTFARDWGGKVRDIIIEHGDYLNLHLKDDKSAADDWALTSGGGMISVGVGGALTGKGADLLIIDDPIKNEEEALSLVYRERIWNWWQATASTRLEPNGVVVIVATRWHEDDLIGRLVNDLPTGYEVISFEALAGEADPLGREPGEMLWPARFFDDPGYALRKEKMTEYWWSSLYQQRPTPEGGGVWKEDFWQFYEELPEGMDQWLQTWDLSLKDKAINDYCVGQVWARKGASNFLVKEVRGQFSIHQVAAHIRQFMVDYPQAVTKLIEDTAMGPSLRQVLQHTVPGMIPIIPKGSKRARAEAVVPLLQAHNCFVPGRSLKDCPKWVKDFIGECASFPKGTHDDRLDAASQGLAWLQPHVWKFEKVEAEKAAIESMPELTPQLARKMMFQKQIDKAMKTSDRRHSPRRHSSRMW